jgi:hypothetical protein
MHPCPTIVPTPKNPESIAQTDKIDACFENKIE